MILDEAQIKFSFNKSLHVSVAFTIMLLFLTNFHLLPVIFYASDDVLYGGIINNHHRPNEQRAKSVS